MTKQAASPTTSTGIHHLKLPVSDLAASLRWYHDWESELCVVFSKRGYQVEAEDAYDYVFGYVMTNDALTRSRRSGRTSPPSTRPGTSTAGRWR